MATIRTRKRKSGTVYIAEICVSGARRSATFDRKSEAQRWAEEAEGLLRARKTLPGGAAVDDMDFIEAAKRYAHQAGKRRRENTRLMYGYCVARLTKAFCGKSLKTITRRDIAEYRDYRLQSVGPSSIIHDFSFLRGIYRAARIEWGIDELECPVDDVRPPAPPKHRMTLLTPDEITKILQTCKASKSPSLYPYVLLLLHTAMRPSEAAGLRWEQVQGNMIDLTVTKTDPRRVPLTEAAAKMLQDMRETAVSEYVFLPPGRKPGTIPSHYFRRSFNTACKRAGIDNFTMYGLRHSAASYLVMNGVDIRTVAEIMGHRNISQTMRYTHFLDEHKLRAIAALEKLGG